MSRVRQKQRRIASAQHSTQKNGIVIQFDEKFLSSPRQPTSCTDHRTPKAKGLGRSIIYIEILHNRAKLDSIWPQSKRRRAPAHRSRKKFSRYHFCVRRFSSPHAIFSWYNTRAAPVHPPSSGARAAPQCDRRHHRSDATMDEKAIIGNIAGSFSSALHE